MPVADMTGAAQNRMDAARYEGALGQQRRAGIVSGLAATGNAVGEAYAKKQMHDNLVASGFTPAEAATIVQSGPAAAARAILDKKREAQHQQFVKERQEAGFTHDKDMDTLEATRQGFTDGVYSPEKDPSVAGQKAQEDYRTALANKQSERVLKETASLGAPVPNEGIETQIIPGGEPFMGPMALPPEEEDMRKRAEKSGYLFESYKNALGRLPKRPEPMEPETDADRALAEQRRAAAERDRAEAELARTPKAPEEKPWKPMTREEQLAFNEENAKRTAAARPQKVPTAADILRDRGAQFMLTTFTPAEQEFINKYGNVDIFELPQNLVPVANAIAAKMAGAVGGGAPAAPATPGAQKPAPPGWVRNPDGTLRKQ